MEQPRPLPPSPRRFQSLFPQCRRLFPSPPSLRPSQRLQPLLPSPPQFPSPACRQSRWCWCRPPSLRPFSEQGQSHSSRLSASRQGLPLKLFPSQQSRQSLLQESRSRHSFPPWPSLQFLPRRARLSLTSGLSRRPSHFLLSGPARRPSMSQGTARLSSLPGCRKPFCQNLSRFPRRFSACPKPSLQSRPRPQNPPLQNLQEFRRQFLQSLPRFRKSSRQSQSKSTNRFRPLPYRFRRKFPSSLPRSPGSLMKSPK